MHYEPRTSDFGENLHETKLYPLRFLPSCIKDFMTGTLIRQSISQPLSSTWHSMNLPTYLSVSLFQPRSRAAKVPNWPPVYKDYNCFWYILKREPSPYLFAKSHKGRVKKRMCALLACTKMSEREELTCKLREPQQLQRKKC